MIILTGGAGFIGSCFLKLLNDKGIKDIIIVDNLGDSTKWKNLLGKQFTKYIHKNNFFNEITNIQNLNVTAIFHFGACSSTTETNIDYLIENNFNFSVRIAEFSLLKQVPFIYASSAATYGDGKEGYDDNIFQPLRPLNGYGFSKHLFDLWVKENGYEKDFAGIKFFNVFGPNEYHKGEMASMVYKAFYQIKNHNKIRLFKSNDPKYYDGEQLRDFVYIKDAVNVIWDIYNKNVKGIFNLGTGIARSWNDLAKSVFSAWDKKPVIEYFDMPEHLIGQYQNHTQAKMDKLINSGVNCSFRTLESGITDYIQNHLICKNQYL